ncbi:MAG: hypothetical protein B6D65_04945 [candidate division Zixibacteria bacterium 4484_93]|nr:MAG: hypothetical protein B6D65_04945 [candidate division Zixibacteria bacterium 4484_93]RKZ34022.1 MAG: hypothetical protein DRQ19_01795 [bacterium]
MLRDKLLFLARFFASAIVLFLLWFFVRDAYISVVGRISVWLSSIFSLGKLEYLVTRSGKLFVRSYAMRADFSVSANPVVANIIPFWALLVASKNIHWNKKLKDALLGFGILLLFHIVALSVIILFVESGSTTLEGIKVFIDALLLAFLPFFLWIFFAGREVSFDRMFE